jgi:SulP family sulfate permease
VIMVITFALTVLVDLVFAVQIGVLLAVLYFFLKMSQSIDVELNELKHITEPSYEYEENKQGVVEFRLQGPIFFGAVERIEQAMQMHHEMIHIIILSFGWVPVMDITALRSLEKLIDGWHKRGIVVKLAGVNPLIEKRMHRVGLLERIGKHNIFAS